MNIQLITPRFGGPYNWGIQLATALQERGFGIQRVSETLPLLMTPLRPWGDITHASVPLPWQRGSSPMVLTVKGDFRKENYIWKYLYPLAIRRAAVVTVPSEFLKHQLGLEQAIVIPNAIQLDSYPERIADTHNKLRILVATKFYFKEKAEGVVRLLEIMQELPADVRSAISINIIGEGPLLADVRTRSQKHDLPISFLGHQNTKKYLYQSDMFLYYSLHDNMPNVVLEAMAAGLPVVTNDIGAIREMIMSGEDGYIVDRDSYREAVLSLILNERRRQKVGAAARRRIERDFNWERVIQQYLDVYERTV